MKKFVKLLVSSALVAAMAFGVCACNGGSTPTTAAPAPTDAPATEAPATEAPKTDGLIKVGIINNDPNESGYRTANDRDMKATFTAENGYDASFATAPTADKQLEAANTFITEGVDYILVSAAETTGWDETLEAAKEAGIGVFLFDRMIDCDPSLYTAAVVSDMRNEGETAVAWLESLGLDEYKVLHIQGQLGSAAQIGRSEPLQEKCEADDKWTMVREGTGGDSWDPNEARKIAEAADCNKWALRELLAGNWNYDGQCSPFQATLIDGMIKTLQAGGTIEGLNDLGQIINEEKGFDARTITEDDIATYGLGE